MDTPIRTDRHPNQQFRAMRLACSNCGKHPLWYYAATLTVSDRALNPGSDEIPYSSPNQIFAMQLSSILQVASRGRCLENQGEDSTASCGRIPLCPHCLNYPA